MTDVPPRFFERVPEESRKSAFERYDSLINMQEERIEWIKELEKKYPEESKARKRAEKILDRTKNDHAKLLRKAT